MLDRETIQTQYDKWDKSTNREIYELLKIQNVCRHSDVVEVGSPRSGYDMCDNYVRETTVQCVDCKYKYTVIL